MFLGSCLSLTADYLSKSNLSGEAVASALLQCERRAVRGGTAAIFYLLDKRKQKNIKKKGNQVKMIPVVLRG